MATLQVRIDDDTRNKAEYVLRIIGVDMPTAIRMYLKKIAQTRSIPFELKAVPDMFTEAEKQDILKAYNDAKKGKNMSPAFSTAAEAKKYLKAA